MLKFPTFKNRTDEMSYYRIILERTELIFSHAGLKNVCEAGPMPRKKNLYSERIHAGYDWASKEGERNISTLQ